MKKVSTKAARPKRSQTPNTLPPPHASGFTPSLRKPKPSFEPFVEKWGLRGNEIDEKDWEVMRAYFGRYLHPKLANWIKFTQTAFDTGRFPYRSHTHPCSKANPLTYCHDSVLEDTRQMASSAKQKAASTKQDQHEPDLVIGIPVPGNFGSNRSQIERINKQRLAEWDDENGVIREQSRRLAEAMLSAVASRDVKFFNHIIEILTLTGYSQFIREPEPAIPAKLAVWLAIKDLRYDDEISQLQKKLGVLPTNISKESLHFIATNDHDITSTRPLDIAELRDKLDDLRLDPDFQKLLPDNWGKNVAACEAQIGRYAQSLGEELARSNKKQPRIRKRV